MYHFNSHRRLRGCRNNVYDSFRVIPYNICVFLNKINIYFRFLNLFDLVKTFSSYILFSRMCIIPFNISIPLDLSHHDHLSILIFSYSVLFLMFIWVWCINLLKTVSTYVFIKVSSYQESCLPENRSPLFSCIGFGVWIRF